MMKQIYLVRTNKKGANLEDGRLFKCNGLKWDTFLLNLLELL